MKYTLLLLFLFITFPTYSKNCRWVDRDMAVCLIDIRHHHATTHILAYRFNLQRYQLSLAVLKKNDYAHRMLTKDDALIAINGGYFTKKNLPIGLRVNNGKKYSQKVNTSWMGVFYSSGNQATITQANALAYQPLRFAIQAGPILVKNNQVYKLRPGLDHRSAIGIINKHIIVLAVSTGAPISLSHWARIMRRYFNCTAALNLDGGTSAQIDSVYGYHIDNFKAVKDIILVRRRQATGY